MANHLKRERQIACLSMLVEGNSVRSTERVTQVHRDTIMRLLVRVGEHCQQIMDRHMRNLSCTDVQCDEIWAYVAKKQKRVEPGDPAEWGDQYTFGETPKVKLGKHQK